MRASVIPGMPPFGGVRFDTQITIQAPNKATDTSGRPTIQIAEVNRISNNMSNFEHTLNDLHDILEAYYKVARKRFVDNVCRGSVTKVVAD